MAGIAHGLRALARPGEFRRRRNAAPQPCQPPITRGMSLSPRRTPSLALLAAVTALAFCALHIVVPALPLLVGAFPDNPARVQLVLTLYLAGIAGGQLVYGPLS